MGPMGGSAASMAVVVEAATGELEVSGAVGLSAEEVLPAASVAAVRVEAARARVQAVAAGREEGWEDSDGPRGTHLNKSACRRPACGAASVRLRLRSALPLRHSR